MSKTSKSPRTLAGMRADLNFLLGKQSALIRVQETRRLEAWVHGHINSPAANGHLALADEILIKIIEAELQARHGSEHGPRSSAGSSI